MSDEKSSGLNNDLRDALKAVSTHALPLEVGRLEITEDGSVRERTSGEPLRFAFTYRGVDFAAELGDADDSRLHVSALLGRLPFTAESPIGRRAICDLIAKAGRFADGSLGLTENHEIVLIGDKQPPTPRTPVSIMATVAALILEMRPRLDFVSECMLALPLETETGGA